MASIIQIRRDTASNWTSANPTLAQGELGIETDTLKVKAGDGSTAWTSASYLIDTGGYAAYSDTTANFTGALQKSGSPVVTAAYTGDVDVTGELIVDSYNETYAAVTSTANATTVNCEAGNAFSHTLTENTTFTFSNPPASGTAFSFSLELIQDASASGYTVTWPAAVDWPAATAPTLTATASAKDIFVFYARWWNYLVWLYCWTGVSLI